MSLVTTALPGTLEAAVDLAWKFHQAGPENELRTDAN
jgi:hypothetical protein